MFYFDTVNYIYDNITHCCVRSEAQQRSLTNDRWDFRSIAMIGLDIHSKLWRPT